MGREERGLRTTILGILVNLILAVVKGLAGFFGNSYALIADAIESTSDIFSSLIVYLGLKVSSKPRDANHPYGHGKAEPIAAILVTVALLIAAGVIVSQSIGEILTPHHAPEAFTLFVLIGVVVVKETLFRTVNRVGKDIESTAVKTDSWHHRSDAITSGAVFVGILVALIGGKGWESADDWAALVASTIIITNAILLFLPAFHEIMDGRPSGDIEVRVRDSTVQVVGVRKVEKCLVRKIGLGYVVDLHIWVDGEISVREGHTLAHRVKASLLEAGLNILDVNVHVEPDGS